MTIRSTRIKSKGQVLALVAVSMVGLLGVLALCTDVAVLYYNWAQLRKEADAAVLAGANYLPDYPSQATSTATNWVGVNGKPGDTILENQVGSLGDNGSGMADSSLTLELQRTVPFYFGRVLGLTTTPVRVLATAGVAPLQSASCWLPIAMSCTGPSCYQSGCASGTTPGNSCYQCGDIVTLNTNQIGSGNWDPVDCPGSSNGASNYISALSTGCCGAGISVNGSTTLEMEPGNPASDTFTGLSQRLGCDVSTCASPVYPPGGQYAPCSPGASPLDPSNPRVVLLPLMNINGVNGRTPTGVPVYGFAVGWIVDVIKGNGSQGTQVNVEFISGTTSAGGTPGTGTASTGGGYAVYLVQ